MSQNTAVLLAHLIFAASCWGSTTIEIKLQKSICKFWSSLKITKNISLQYDIYFDFTIKNFGFVHSALWHNVKQQGAFVVISSVSEVLVWG